MWTLTRPCGIAVLTSLVALLLPGQGICSVQRRDIVHLESDLRLVGGSSDTNGRLEIYHTGQWGSICNDFWDQKDSFVACRQLGYKSVVSVFNALESYEIGPADSPIWFDNVHCVGNESKLADCTHNGWGEHNCGHGEDIALECSSTEVPDGEVRLVYGSSAREGRLVIYHDLQWGSISGYLNLTDVQVACRQLGFRFAVRSFSGYSIFGRDAVTTDWLDGSGITCTGDEDRLADCRHLGFGNTTSFPSDFDDVGIICSDLSSSDDITLAQRVRLVGGSGPHEGRAEIFHKGKWGTISSERWDRVDGHVLCTQLGYPTVSTIIHGNQWSGLNFGGPGNGTIWLSGVQCAYSATNLYACSGWTIASNSLSHEDDAGAVCQTDPITTPENSLRLVGGESALQGRLEVFHFGVWGTVCDDNFSILSAKVACRQLGFLDAYQFNTARTYGIITGDQPTLLESVRCLGNESSIADCEHAEWGSHDCSHSEDIAILCANETSTGIEEFSLRLINGPTPLEGRLEIFASGQWGTVCDDLFDQVDGRVACLQLGFTGVARVITTYTTYGSGVGTIVLDDVQCTGQEQTLSDCPNRGIGTSNCQHTEDVGLQCSNTSVAGGAEGSLRLEGGTTPAEGRLEIYHLEQWGTVCDDYFDGRDAEVACKQLGYTGFDRIVLGGFRDTDPVVLGSPIWLDNLGCDGNESMLAECLHPGWGNENCGHGEDVGLACTNGTEVDADEGALRLVGGLTPNQGRLEIRHNGLWGTVCDDIFEGDDALVACKQLGYETHTAIVTDDRYGTGTGAIWLDDVECLGTESSLSDCTHAGWSQNNCGHVEDVGIVCSDSAITTTPRPEENSLRLVGGITGLDGRLEIYHDGSWGTICDDYFDIDDARVACKQLGYADTESVLTNVEAGSGTIWLDDLRCTSDHRVLSQCPHNGWGSSNCGHTEDVGVVCTDEDSSNVPDGSLRLVNGESEFDGRLEVFHEGTWGTVCDDLFNIPDGTVACKQLGFANMEEFFGAADNVPPATGRIWLGNLGCNGNEGMLKDCLHVGWGNSDCSHSQDIALRCHNRTTTDSDATIRLAGIGSTALEGRLEILHNGVWGTVCDDSFNTPDAKVVCRQLGFTGVERIVVNDVYGIGSGTIWLDDLLCIGTEERIEDCPNNGWGTHNCGHSEDIGIVCSNASIAIDVEEGSLRLVSDGPSNDNEGRLEIYHSGEWGTICDDLFDRTDGEIACRQLGFATVTEIVTDDRYGPGTGSIWIDDISCSPGATSILECTHRGWGINNCGHSEDIAIICTSEVITTTPPPIVPENSLRLVGGSSLMQGRLEIYHDGLWGTVCDDYFDLADGHVACRQLGFSDASEIIVNDIYGIGSGNIWLDDVSCSGTEQYLHDCGNTGWGTNNCGHSEDVGIICNNIISDYTYLGCFRDSEVRAIPNHMLNRPTMTLELCFEHCQSYSQHYAAVQFATECWCGGIETDYAQYGAAAEDDCNSVCGGNSRQMCGGTWKNSVYSIVMTEGQLRLVGGDGPNEGRLEIFHDGEWGTICDDYFGTEDGNVACSQLGFGPVTSVITDDPYGPGTGEIWLDDLGCVGSEASLSLCSHGGWSGHNCGHNEDIALICGIPATQAPTTAAPSNNLRLVGGPSPNEGRLEIYHSGVWGTICDDYFVVVDGNVACRQLGFGEALAIVTDDSYGYGTGTIWLDDINCSGTESNLASCGNQGWGTHNCGHSEDVGLVCSSAARDPECYTELYGQDYRGFVNVTNTNITCQAWSTQYPHEHTRTLENLPERVGDHNYCRNPDAEPDPGGPWCYTIDPDIRWQFCNVGLRSETCDTDVGSSTTECFTDPLGQEYRGHVNVTQNGITCQKWTVQNPHEHTRTPTAYPGAGLGDHNYCRNPDAEPGGPWCYTVDSDIRWQYCSVGEASVECPGLIEENSLRLVSSSSSALRGRLEIYHNGEWGTICDDDFDLVDGGVACRQLGFTGAVSIEDPVVYATGEIFLDNMACVGTETSLSDCPNAGWGTHNCGHSEDVVLVCTDATITGREGELRLADGSGDHEGRVEIYHSGRWGTVCDDDWGEPDGRVVCAQLGFASLDHTTIGASFGQGTGEIWLDQVSCNGNEAALADCSHNGWSTHNCGHGEDAGVVCSQVIPTGPEGGLRLVDGATLLEGRLEIFHNNEWGTVCDDYFDITDAQVACRQLGYSGGAVFDASDGFGTTWLDNLQCLGEETLLSDCPHNGWGIENCGHSEDVGITCEPAISENEGALRLMGGSNRREGRVEINHNNEWGTICGTTWSIDEGTVVCKQLGFPGVYAIKANAFYGEGSGRVLDSIDCTGSEERLTDCSHNEWAATSCGHDQDAGVMCLRGNLPVISNCPSDRHVPVRAGSTGTPVHWNEPTCQDQDGNNVPALFKTHESGSSFYLGSTIVSYIFLDGTYKVAKCSFTIIGELLDVTPPRISDCPMDQTISIELGEEDVEFSWPQPHASDNSGNVTLKSRSHRPGFRFPLGSTRVVYIFTDSNANVASCSFVVNVNTVDTSPPVINGCPVNLNVMLTGDSWGKTVSWPEPIPVDASRNAYVLFQSHQPGAMFPPGTSVVTYVYSDPSHNLAKCSFTVNVNSGSVTLDVSMTMAREFNDALSDPNSPDFNNLKTTMVSTMDEILDDSTLASSYSMTEILQFRPGSIVADCRVHLNPDQPSPQQDAPLALSMATNDDVQSLVLQILQKAAQPNGPLAALGIDPSTVSVRMQTKSPTSPIISRCPKTITMSVKPNAGGVVVSWIEPTATDAAGIVPLISQSHEPGTSFTIGSTVVKYTFGRTPVDTSSCVFTVAVVKGDVAITVQNCPEDILTQDTADGRGTNVKWIEPSAMYKSTNTTVVFQSHKPGDAFAAGKTMVSYIFEASNGVEASCDFAVIVDTKGGTSTLSGGGHGLSVAGLVIAIMVAFIVLLLIAGAYMMYKRRRQSGYSIEMQNTGFDGPPSPIATSEYKSLF